MRRRAPPGRTSSSQGADPASPHLSAAIDIVLPPARPAAHTQLRAVGTIWAIVGGGDTENDVDARCDRERAGMERSTRQTTDRQSRPVSIVFISRLIIGLPRSSVIISRSCSKFEGLSSRVQGGRPPTAASLAHTTRRHSLASVSTTEDAVPTPRRREQQLAEGPQSRTKFGRKWTRFTLTSRGANRLPPNGRVRCSTQYWLYDAHIGPTSQHRSLRPSHRISLSNMVVFGEVGGGRCRSPPELSDAHQVSTLHPSLP
jgi:hypothetical protein